MLDFTSCRAKLFRRCACIAENRQCRESPSETDRTCLPNLTRRLSLFDIYAWNNALSQSLLEFSFLQELEFDSAISADQLFIFRCVVFWRLIVLILRPLLNGFRHDATHSCVILRISEQSRRSKVLREARACPEADRTRIASAALY